MDIVKLDPLALSDAIHHRVISCVEVMRAYLDRIEACAGANAIVSLRPEDDLLAEATDADRALAAGRSAGWMHGMPQAVKDLAACRGLSFTQGSPIDSETIAEEDASFVAPIRWCVVIGRANLGPRKRRMGSCRTITKTTARSSTR